MNFENLSMPDQFQKIIFFFKLLSFLRREVIKESEQKVELRHFRQSLKNMQVGKQFLKKNKKVKKKLF